MALDEITFNTLAAQLLETYSEIIEDILGDSLDADLEGEILMIELNSGSQYIINKHAPNREIWMSSPVSGATHFAYDEQKQAWFSTRGAERLSEMLAAELTATTGTSISLPG